MMNSNRERKRILLVEDEEDAREIAALSLEEYTLICAHNFDEGLRLARQEKALRLKAERAFLAAGGARGDFAREWPSVFLGEVRGARKSAAGSGD